MKYSIYPFIVSLIIALVCQSCERNIYFVPTDQERKLVINSYVIAGDSIYIQVSQSQLFSDLSHDIKVRDINPDQLEVSLLINDEKVPVEMIPDSIFGHRGHPNLVAKKTPQPGDRVTISATYPGVKPVTSSLVLPAIPSIGKLSYKVKEEEPEVDHTGSTYTYDPNTGKRQETKIIRTTYSKGFYFDLPVHDDTQQRNFYLLSITAVEYRDIDGVRTPVVVFRRFETDDPNFKEASFGIPFLGESGNLDYFVLSDMQFKGATYPFSFYTKVEYRSETQQDGRLFVREGDLPEDMEVIVHVAQLTEGAYYFLRSMNALNSSKDNPLAEPVRVHTNIKGGLGIFAGFSFASCSTLIPMKH